MIASGKSQLDEQIREQNLNDKNLLIAAKDGYLSVEVLQIGTWGIFSPADFYFTFSPKTNEFLI